MGGSLASAPMPMEFMVGLLSAVIETPELGLEARVSVRRARYGAVHSRSHAHHPAAHANSASRAATAITGALEGNSSQVIESRHRKFPKISEMRLR